MDEPEDLLRQMRELIKFEASEQVRLDVVFDTLGRRRFERHLIEDLFADLNLIDKPGGESEPPPLGVVGTRDLLIYLRKEHKNLKYEETMRLRNLCWGELGLSAMIKYWIEKVGSGSEE